MKYLSETSRHKYITIPFISQYFGELDCLNGIDIGFGGDTILPNTICMDLPKKYTTNVIQTSTQNLFGDCADMYWFKDNCMDYVYSSHVLEDFDEDSIDKVLNEWIRIIKHKGLLILDLPNEKNYRSICDARGYRSNPRHKIIDMSVEYMIEKTKHLNLKLIYSYDKLPPDNYSFLMIWCKL